MALVFQYGSNASSGRINSDDRLKGDASFIDVVFTAKDFEFEFPVWSKSNQCAAASIFSGNGREIWGALYEIPDYLIRRKPPGNRKSLDAIEGEGRNYIRQNIAVKYRSSVPVKEDVITYIAKSRETGLRTSFEYITHIIYGLREIQAPQEYIEYIKERIILNNSELMGKIEAL